MLKLCIPDNLNYFCLNNALQIIVCCNLNYLSVTPDNLGTCYDLRAYFARSEERRVGKECLL